MTYEIIRAPQDTTGLWVWWIWNPAAKIGFRHDRFKLTGVDYSRTGLSFLILSSKSPDQIFVHAPKQFLDWIAMQLNDMSGATADQIEQIEVPNTID